MFTHVAQAATKYTELQNTLPGGANDLLGVIDNVTNWFFTILLALAVVFVIIAAYKYLMSGGGEEVGAAHKMILYAAVAVAVAVLSRGLVSVTKVLIGGGSSSSSAPSDSWPTTEDTRGTVDEAAGVVTYFIGGKLYKVDLCSSGIAPGLGLGQGTGIVWYGKKPIPVNPALKNQDGTPVSGILRLSSGINVQICDDNDGTIPTVTEFVSETSGGTLYYAKDSDGNSVDTMKEYTNSYKTLSSEGASIKAEHQAAVDSGYQLNKSPEVLVPYCPGDGKVVSVYYKGTIYEAPLEMRANSTQMNTYVPNNATASDGASVGNCEDGSAPSPVWLGLQRYYQK